MLKKMIALALAFVMCLGIAATAWAASYKEVIPLKYDYVNSFSDGLAAVMLNGKWGFIDKKGNVVVPLKYVTVVDFSEGLAAVGKGDLGTPEWSLIDKSGKEVAQLAKKYRYVGRFIEGMAYVDDDMKIGYIDKTGKEVIPAIYGFTKYFNDFSEGMAAVYLNDKWGYIDKAGNTVIPFKYSSAESFSEGLAVVGVSVPAANPTKYHKFDTYFSYIDIDGKEVFAIDDYGYSFSDGLAMISEGFELDQRFGFIDKTGKEVIPLIYKHPSHSFSEGLASMTTLNNQKVYINKTGKVVIEGKRGDNFSEGLAMAYGQNGKYGFMDKTGKEVVQSKYDRVRSFSEGFAAVSLDKKWGFIAADSTVDVSAKATPTTVGLGNVK